MTEICEFLHRAEENLVRSAGIGSSMWSEFEKLSPGVSGPLRNAMAFVGCKAGREKSDGSKEAGSQAHAVGDEERIAAIRLVLVKLKVHTADPAWSSDLLYRIVDAVVEMPGGGIGDLFHALFSVFADYTADLSKARANFIKDLVSTCFTRHRSGYDAFDWKGFANQFGPSATTSQLYLALLAVPPDDLPNELASTIANALEHTPYREEALRLLAA